LNAFIITFRESLEAGVIVGLLLSVLASFQAHKHYIFVWYGVILWIIFSVLFYLGFTYVGNGFSGTNEKIYEWTLMVGAAILITHMTFWMRGQSKGIKQRIESKVETHLANKALWMIGVIAFLSVVREWVETVIFFSALEVQSDGLIQVVFWLVGIVAAILLSVMIFSSSRHVDVKKFFHISGLLLLFVSAGLLAHGIVEFQGADILPTFMKPIYDVSPLLSEKEWVGMFLKALFGYDANPSLMAVVWYTFFVAITLQLYLKKSA